VEEERNINSPSSTYRNTSTFVIQDLVPSNGCKMNNYYRGTKVRGFGCAQNPEKREFGKIPALLVKGGKPSPGKGGGVRF